MKKCIILLLALCLFLTACGGDGGETAPTTTTTTAGKPATIYYSDYAVFLAVPIKLKNPLGSRMAPVSSSRSSQPVRLW